MTRENNLACGPILRWPLFGRAVGLTALTAALTFAGFALSCGYEDPNSASLQRGALNLSYPNALYVLGVMAHARAEGLFQPAPEPPATKDLFGSEFRKTAGMLERFGDALRVDSADDLSFSMVLVEPMSWTRFAMREGRVVTSVHVNGPLLGDVVVIATEAALREIDGGHLAAADAEKTALIRMYGDPEKIARLKAILAAPPKPAGH